MTSFSRARRTAVLAADACARALGELSVDVVFKWPNDLLLATPSLPLGPWGQFRKVGGVLVEAIDIDASFVSAVVVGIGINLARPPSGFVPELELIAGSLDDAGVHVARDTLLPILWPLLADATSRTNDQRAWREALERTRSRCITLGQPVTLAAGPDGGQAVAVALDDEARLIVRLPDQTLRRIEAAADLAT